MRGIESVYTFCILEREKERQDTHRRIGLSGSYTSFKEYTLLCWFICLCSGMVSSSSCSH